MSGKDQKTEPTLKQNSNHSEFNLALNQPTLNSALNLPEAVPDFEGTIDKVNYLLTSLLEMLENADTMGVPNNNTINGAVLLKHDILQDLDAIFEHSLTLVPKLQN
jgi:hypothetical protein